MATPQNSRINSAGVSSSRNTSIYKGRYYVVVPYALCLVLGMQLGMNYTVLTERMTEIEYTTKRNLSAPSRCLTETVLSAATTQRSEQLNAEGAPTRVKHKNRRQLKDKDRYTKLFVFDEDNAIQEREEVLWGDHSSNRNDTTLSGTLNYPFIPQSILSNCGVDKFGVTADNSPALIPLNHSLGYIRPHKTGSTTIKGVIHRILYGRGMIDMVSTDLTYLGWPDAFPGDEVVGLENVLHQTRYDAFTHHSVFSLNRSAYMEYLKPNLSLFTILREPISRTISAYHYFAPQKDDDDSDDDDDDDGENADESEKEAAAFTDWREFLNKYQHVTVIQNWMPAVFLNNLAFSLGWYHQPHINHSTFMDHNVTEIKRFLDKLDQELDFVMVLEHLVESLVLWKHLVVPEVHLSELVWYDRNAEVKNKTFPNEQERIELFNLLFLDRMIYDHFKVKFELQWQQETRLHPELIEMKDSLQCLRTKIVQKIAQEEENDDEMENRELSTTSAEPPLPATLKEYLTLPAVQYTRMLRSRQIRRFGCDVSSICP